MIFWLLFVLIVFAAVDGEPSSSCSQFIPREDNYTYAYYTDGADHIISNEGGQYCANKIHPKSFLALVTNQTDVLFICDKVIKPTLGRYDNAVIGLIQQNTSVEPGGGWFWTVDGVSADDRKPFWGSGKPDNGASFSLSSAQCAHVDCLFNSHALFDFNCGDTVPAVCQIISKFLKFPFWPNVPKSIRLSN
jgi:hypothetical protein